MDNTLYTVAVFSENRVGLLNQISIIFTRRKLNIESLSVSPSSIKGVHKFTITAYSDEETIEKLVQFFYSLKFLPIELNYKRLII